MRFEPTRVGAPFPVQRLANAAIALICYYKFPHHVDALLSFRILFSLCFLPLCMLTLYRLFCFTLNQASTSLNKQLNSFYGGGGAFINGLVFQYVVFY